MIGSQDILIALALGMILFGAKKLPELARGLGESLKEFKKATTQPDGSSAASAQPPTLSTSAGPVRGCASCQTVLHADWAHCPKCGAAAPVT